MRSLSLRLHHLLAASLCAMPIHLAGAQSGAAITARPVVGLHDSIDVASLEFAGASEVSPDDLKLIVFTRTSSCRLVLIAPLCKLSRSQLFIDRRRTTPAALGEDITKLRVYYWQRGFRDAQVDTVLVPAKHGMAVAFRIVEGEPTRIGTLDIAQRAPVLSARELKYALVVRAGGPLDLIALDTTLNRLRDAVWNKGYGDVRVDTIVPRPDAHVAPVRIDIDPRWITRVGRVQFEGNRALSDATLRRGVMLRPGTLYTRDAVLESQRRLFEQPLIARAVVVTPPAGDSVKTITVAVAEQKPRHVEATLGFNTIEFGQAALDVRHNALGAGRWLRLYGSVGNLLADQLNGRGIFQQVIPEEPVFNADPFILPAYEASLTLTQPWIAGARTSAALRAFANRRVLTGVAVDQSAGGFVGIARDLALKAPIGINYRIEATRVEAGAVYFCAGYGVCDAATIQALSNTQRLAPIGASAWIDRSDDLDSPTRGYTALLDAEHASHATGSTFEHNRVMADASYYKPFGGAAPLNYGIAKPPKVLALHVRAGMVHPFDSDRAALGVNTPGEGIAHPRALFYAGGMQSVRGFAENELGPRVLQVRSASLLAAGCTVASIASALCDPSRVPNDQLFPTPTGGSSLIEGNIELRVPLMKALNGVVFVDGARVGTSGLATVGHAKGAVTPGFGFRYRSPLGVIRLDFGIRPVGEELLPVVVAVPDTAGEFRVVRLQQEKSYSPVEDPSPGTWHAIARRIVVHFAMGQAF